jgi:DNA-binding PadR family transcriptional regulator
MNDPTLLVLASLADGEKHGYAIMEDIRCFAGTRLGPGTLYGAITRLEQQKFIRRAATQDRRQPYVLTSAGRRYMRERIANLGQVVRTALERLGNA